MRYVQLRAFHYVAIHGGFSRAAEALRLTQPAISDQVRHLEEEYDILLFNRNKKQVTITEPGKKLLRITHRLFENERQAQDLLSETRALRSGTLRIVADSPHHLLHILAPFRQKYPGIFVSVRTGNSGDVLNGLSAYEADIGVLGEVPVRRDLDVVRLNSAPIIAFAAADYPLKDRESITLKALAAHPLVLRERGSKTRRLFEEAAARAGVEVEAAIEAEGREAVREIVASGAGLGIVSAAEFGHDDRLVRLPIRGQALKMEESLICLRERNGGKLIRAFMDLARHCGSAPS